MSKTVSIIVPTHNRSSSLMRLLNIVARQTYPLSFIEVIAVADGCNDDTLAMLQQYQAAFTIKTIELPGAGAATARNSGADAATGEILLFLDDDIEPSEGLVEAHVREHDTDNKVVVGYLPMTMPKKASLHEIGLTTWWDEKYADMRNPTYRHNYEDLLSGNFSIAAALFHKVNKFDTSFRCREDYELGVRLINAEAEFVFSDKAWGYHRDESTNLTRLYQRKKEEGKADVQLATKHPELLSRLHLDNYKPGLSRKRKWIFYMAFNAIYIGDKVFSYLQKRLGFYERLKKRSSWAQLNFVLKEYWYLRGVAEALKTKEQFNAFLENARSSKVNDKPDFVIDLKIGLPEAEKQLDQSRPDGLHIMYGDHFVGSISSSPGSERLRGAHLKPMLATEFSKTLVHALMVEQVIKQTPAN